MVQLCADLNEEKVNWHVSWIQKSHIIYYCQNYPNVPLMGTQGCINYNPILAQRQFGILIKGAPIPTSLVTLRIYYEEGFPTEVLRQIRNTWKRVVRAERDPRPWSINERVSYHQWVVERVQEIKLPLKTISLCQSTKKPSLDSEIEEVEFLRENMEKMKQDNIRLPNDLENLQRDYTKMKWVSVESKGVYEELLRKQKEDLAATHIELRIKALECGIFESAKRVRKKMLSEINREKEKALKKLHNMQITLDDSKQQVKESMAKLENERWHRAKSEKRHQELMVQMKEYTIEEGQDIEH